MSNTPSAAAPQACQVTDEGERSQLGSRDTSSTSSEQFDRFQILALDGGGMRGVFSAAILAAIEEDCSVRISDSFDLIAGTSTGGILAIGLGLGLSPREMVEFYVKFGPQIFSRAATGLFSPRYSAASLASVLQEKFGDRLFGDSAKRLVVPAFDLGNNQVHVFRTAHLERLRRDHRLPAWQVAMATAAAPTYFPAHRLPDHVRLVDGGVWANNPSMVALTEAVARRHLGVPIDRTHVLSVGTIAAKYGSRSDLDNGGLLAWRKSAMNVVLDASSLGVSNQARALLDERFVRVNADAVESETKMDDATKVAALIGSARNVSRNEMPAIAQGFLAHRARPFIPFHNSKTN